VLQIIFSHCYTHFRTACDRFFMSVPHYYYYTTKFI